MFHVRCSDTVLRSRLFELSQGNITKWTSQHKNDFTPNIKEHGFSHTPRRHYLHDTAWYSKRDWLPRLPEYKRPLTPQKTGRHSTAEQGLCQYIFHPHFPISIKPHILLAVYRIAKNFVYIKKECAMLMRKKWFMGNFINRHQFQKWKYQLIQQLISHMVWAS